MINNKKEDSGKLFQRYTEISTNSNDNNLKKSLIDTSNKLNNLSNSKSKDDEIATSFGEFVLMMDNKEEYRKTIINNGKGKVWKAINKIKNAKDFRKIYKDPSLTKWYIINPDQNKVKPYFDSLFCILLYIDFILSPFEFFVYQYKYKYYRIALFDIIFSLEIISHFFTSYYDSKNKYYITDIKKIFINYLKSGFIPSLVYILPLYIFRKDLEMLRFIKLYRYPYVNNKIKRLVTWLLSFIIKNITIISQIVRVFTFFINFIHYFSFHIFYLIFVFRHFIIYYFIKFTC